MSPLRLGRRALLPAVVAATLAAGIHAASSPSVAAASTPERPSGALTCVTVDPWGGSLGITLCHEGFEIQIAQRHPDGRISGRVRAADGWHAFTVRPTDTQVVVLIGANDYGLVAAP
jgi:hypothetical protein